MRPRTPRAPRAALHLTTLLALVAAPLALGFPAPAAAVPSTGLIITEVYPGGGNSGATYNADFVEVYNTSDSAISLGGKSLQYRAGTGTTVPTQTTYALPNVSVPSHSYYLIGGSASTTNGVPSPRTPDVVTGLGAGASAGQVYLADTTAAINPVVGAACVQAGGTIDYGTGKVIDFFGYGTQSTTVCTTGTNSYESASKAGTIPNTSSYKRTSLVDNDNNNTDFTIAAVSAASGSGTGTGPDSCDCFVTPSLKITEVYTDGGQAGSAYDHDFVELQNTSGSTLPMAGLTLQYRAPGDTGPATVVATLTGSMAGGTFDVAQLAGTTGNGAVLTAPEYTAYLDLSATSGTLFVAKSTTGIDPGTGAVAADQYRGDLVGWGTAGAFETAAADATDLAPATSLQRANGGVDSNDNSADFASYAPSPNLQPAIPTKTIPEIQGTGPTTSLANANVSTSGVVTAAYANGTDNFNGFYLQTAGYDPASDATPLASDGIFVFTGSSTTFPTPAVGQHVTLSSAKVSEFRGMTELTMTNPANLAVRTASAAETVRAGTVLPGTDCALPGTGCLTGTALAAAREAHEGELFQPTSPYTVTDSYDGSPWDQPSEGFQMKGEIGLAANSTEPLIAPTEVANPTREAAALAARIAWNEAHRVTLDDAHNADYTASANRAIAFPWLTATHTVRVGADVTFVQPVIFDFRNDLWKLQPQSKVTGDGESKVSIEQDRPAAPADVLGATGNLKIATFNMLNYFVHAAQDWAATPDSAVGKDYTCSYNRDRAGVPTTAGSCTWTDLRMDPDLASAPGPRGAADAAAFERQEDKELEAINKIDADVLSLEEVENAIKIGDYDRDAALQQLVPALNAHWAANHPGEDPALGERWAYVASPRPAAQATVLEQDAIRPAFIYNPRTVETVGRSQMLVNSAPFRNAREPLAQGFKRVGGNRDDGFIVIANHFKSKSPAGATGDNVDKGDGAGSYNGDRTRQAKALDSFADGLAADLDIPAVFLTGDLNAYSHEDPIEALRETGWHTLESDNGEKSYSFGGYSGSLDHALANDAALAMVTGSTVWTINANEPVFYEYSRHNFNVTDLYAVNPFRSSDHNPEIIGVNAPKNPPLADLDTVQVLASNDFHGRLLADPASASAGAAAMATAVKGLRDPVMGNPNTVFAMAGDIVGASTFESFIQNDKPTIDAMNGAGLEVSAAGNHEFDQGYDDLMNRIMSDTHAQGGADWPYIAANVRKAGDGSYALETTREDGNFAHSNGATWWKQFDGLNDGAGIRVGFVGAVTEDLESLVAPGNLDGLAITSIVDEVNDAAADLTIDGCGGEPCDLVVELVHEGAPTPSCDVIKADESSAFGRIVHGASDDVDAIVSGHTHLKYNCKVEVPGKTFSDGKQYKRPVVSAGQYGSYLNQLQFDFAPDTADLVGIRQHVLAMKDYDDDADTKAIVDAAVEVAAVKGAVELGEVTGPFKRARRTDSSGTVENRGGESTLGNLVAEIQREATDAEIGVMNPGGLRDDLIGTGNGPGPVTYREAANVQPFANTLVTTELTGAQLKLLLEQQWQRDPDNNVPSRPFLRLGTSKGFTWTEDSSHAEGDRITGMWLNGTAIDAGETYTVAANSFVASGGDNFRALTLGTGKRDTGVTDLQATVDYLDAHAPLSVDFAQHAVGARVPSGPYSAGHTVTFDVDSLSMTGEGDLTDATMAISIGARDLGTFNVTTNLPATPYDIPGAGTVSFTLPSALSGGIQWVTLTGGTTGTVATVPVDVVDTRDDSTVSGSAADITWGEAGSVSVTVTPATAEGTVELYDGATRIGEGTLTGDATTIAIPAKALPVGTHTLTLTYLGNDDTKPSQGSVRVTVVKASSTVSGTAADITWGQAGSVSVSVTPSAASGTVELYDGATKLGEGNLGDGGTTTIAIAAKALPVGTHSLTLKYLGDGNHAGDEGTVSVTVVKASSSVSGTAADITWGNAGSVSVTVTPSAASGTVELYDGATKLGEGNLTSGATSITIAAKSLAVGDHLLTLKYLGDGNHSSSQSTVSAKVLKAPTTVSAPDVTLQWAKASSVAITVTPPAGGTVELYDGATKLGEATLRGDGTARIALPARSLEVGTHTLTVKYLGSGTHAASQSTVTVTVTKGRSKVEVDMPTSVDAGDRAKIKATVDSFAADVAGKVEFLVKEVGGGFTKGLTRNLGNGKGAAKIRLPRSGKYVVKVKYLGDEHTLRDHVTARLRVS